MRAYVSLWSADLLALGEAVDRLGAVVDGFHLDVFDGAAVRDLLFGPAHVAALRRRTTAVLDVHLMVSDPDRWIRQFADAGADMITAHAGRRSATDVRGTLDRIRDCGCQPSMGLETHEPVDLAVAHFDVVDRVLLLGRRSV